MRTQYGNFVTKYNFGYSTHESKSELRTAWTTVASSDGDNVDSFTYEVAILRRVITEKKEWPETELVYSECGAATGYQEFRGKMARLHGEYVGKYFSS